MIEDQLLVSCRNVCLVKKINYKKVSMKFFLKKQSGNFFNYNYLVIFSNWIRRFVLSKQRGKRMAWMQSN